MTEIFVAFAVRRNEFDQIAQSRLFGVCCADFADKFPHPVCRLEIGLRVGHGQHEANVGVNCVISGKNFGAVLDN